MIINAFDEHREVRDMIDPLKQLDTSIHDFQQAMIELEQTLADHVFEEEDAFFPEAQLTVDTKTLGLQMQQRKQQLLSAAA